MEVWTAPVVLLAVLNTHGLLKVRDLEAKRSDTRPCMIDLLDKRRPTRAAADRSKSLEISASRKGGSSCAREFGEARFAAREELR